MLHVADHDQDEAATVAERLRKSVLQTMCEVCGLPSSSETIRRCGNCNQNLPPPSDLKCAYVSMIYGGPDFGAPAMALGYSLARVTGLPRILLHTTDVPELLVRALRTVWSHVVLVEYICCRDLDRSGIFGAIFTKLHCLDPNLFHQGIGGPYDKVLFLDVDTLVLRNPDELFGLRPPAARHNDKSTDSLSRPHGVRLLAGDTYINAGVMLLAPNWRMFSLLHEDVQKTAAWHRRSWSPEQAYLHWMWGGEITNISLQWNFEPTPHRGVPLTKLWNECPAHAVHIAHFSGGPKVWTMPASSMYHDQSGARQRFREMTKQVFDFTRLRRDSLRSTWNQHFVNAVRHCHGHLGRWTLEPEEAAKLPIGFLEWVAEPPPMIQDADFLLRAVLRRVPREHIHKCARKGCMRVVTWHVSHCCSRCHKEDPRDERECCDNIKHGPKCDCLDVDGQWSVWNGPPEEQQLVQSNDGTFGVQMGPQ